MRNTYKAVSFMLPVEEMNELRKEADARNMSASALVRERLFGAPVVTEIGDLKTFSFRIEVLEAKSKDVLEVFKNTEKRLVALEEKVKKLESPSLVSAQPVRVDFTASPVAVRPALKDIAARSRAVGSFDPDEEA